MSTSPSLVPRFALHALAALVLVVAGALLVPAGAASAEVTPGTDLAGVTVSGTITTSSNVGLANADVSLRTFDEDSGDVEYYSDNVVTSSTGRYTFTSVPPGRYRLYAEPNNDAGDLGTYFEATSDYASATPVVVGTANIARNIKLLAGARIAGTVSAPGGEALEGVSVDILTRYSTDCADCWSPVGYGYSDADGRYSVGGLEPGTYRVRFSADDYQREFFNNVRSLATASDITLAAGASRTDVNARMDAGGTITGTVRDSAGRVLPGVRVTASGDAPDDEGHSAETDEDGRYEIIALPSDRYTLTAGGSSTPEFDEESTSRSVTAPQTVSGADLTLTRRAVIAGAIVDHTGAAVADARLEVFRKTTSADGTTSYETFDRADYRVADGGTYQVFVPAGTYRISASGRDRFYDPIDATTFFPSAGDLASAEDITVASMGQQVGGKNIRLLEASRIAGKVTFPTGSTEYIPVEVIDSVTGATVDNRSVAAEDGGTFEISGLAAGSYKVQFGRASGASQLTGQFFDGVAEGNGLTAARTITLSPGQSRTDVNASMSSGSVLTGTVRQADGDPAPGCRVQAFSPSGLLSTREGYTAADGSFRITGLSAGSYQVAVNNGRRLSEKAAAWRCPGLTAPAGDVLPDPGYFTSQDGSMTTTAAGARAVAVGSTGTTTLPVTLKFAASPAAPVKNVERPEISGTARVGATLSATPGVWNPADASFSYQWQANGSNVGTDQATYTPTASDLGKTITVTVTAAKSGLASGVETSPSTSPVATNVIANTVAPTLPTTAPRVGTPISVNPGTWNPSDVAFTFQWLGDGVDIAGATGGSYTPVAGDVGKTISVRVTGAKATYVSTTAVSNATPAVSARAVANTAAPSLPTAAPRVGTPVTANPGTWDPSDVSFAYQWLADGVEIPGATEGAYTPAASDVGKSLSVRVTGSKAGHASATATSNTTAAVAPQAVVITSTTAPSLTGTAKVGQVLSTNGGTWAPGSVTLTYQWLRDGAAISGATSTRYRLVASDLGKRVSVRVTASHPEAASSASRTSATSAAVAKGTLVLKGTARITGSPKVGSTLRATPQTASPAATIRYQWLRAGKAISGATKSTYKASRSDKGKRLSVRITYSRSGYTTVVKSVALSRAIA